MDKSSKNRNYPRTQLNGFIKRRNPRVPVFVGKTDRMQNISGKRQRLPSISSSHNRHGNETSRTGSKTSPKATKPSFTTGVQARELNPLKTQVKTEEQVMKTTGMSLKASSNAVNGGAVLKAGELSPKKPVVKLRNGDIVQQEMQTKHKTAEKEVSVLDETQELSQSSEDGSSQLSEDGLSQSSEDGSSQLSEDDIITPSDELEKPEAEMLFNKTPEEIEAVGKEKAQKFAKTFEKSKSINLMNPDGITYSAELFIHLKSIDWAFYTLQKQPLPVGRAARKEAANMMLASGSLQLLCDIVAKEFQSGASFSGDSPGDRNHRMVLDNAMSPLWNYTDCSDEVTYFVCAHRDLLPNLLKWVAEWCPLHLKKELPDVIDFFLEMALNILHNVSMREENIDRCRELGITRVLMPYLNTSNSSYKMIVYATLADVVSEEEADKLATSPGLARFLLFHLEMAMKSSKHRFEGLSVTELVRAVRQLARNDANKRLLVNEGVIPLLMKGISSSLTDEKHDCMETLWVLSFDKENTREMMKNEELLDHVVKAAHDHTQPSPYRKSAAGLLWQLREELAASEKYRAIGEDYLTLDNEKSEPTQTSTRAAQRNAAGDVKAGTKTSVPVGHVMMSYQWANQKVVKQLRDVLKAEGFKVWMDIDDMEGSTLQAMASAVEEAYAVVICMSQKYKDSPFTRAEAEYAFQKNKKIIPLVMQLGYRPDGWLGIILGAKLFYDFSGKYPFETRIEGFVKAVREAAGIEGADETDGSTVNPPPREPSDEAKVKAWSAGDVKTWLTKHSINRTQLEKLTGREIVFLYKLRSEAPEYFYRTLEKKLHITTLSGLITFTDALQDLLST